MPDTVREAAVKHGRIIAVGSDADVEGLAGAGTRVLDCPGKTVVPGFIDSHTHSTHVGEFRDSNSTGSAMTERGSAMRWTKSGAWWRSGR